MRNFKVINMSWQDIVKQKPLNLSPLEAAAAFEYGGKDTGEFMRRAKEAAPKMPPHIREGLERAVRWMEENM